VFKFDLQRLAEEAEAWERLQQRQKAALVFLKVWRQRKADLTAMKTRQAAHLLLS